ncbi:hypothetical protein CONLIGDRAFT_679861 [Coniochaeta ligniaria NRRL 30616]|uniref:CBM1 domain-containing protein n=1 Tax=Coniochaeta ligniaria NRRL 30616 TaxID=1408157 RepID=A0A1J7JMM7_9PEZI|nr:hypothetical protein CONLIGDRAFT_679861 [Coniochaeta ligniaria NRRL 30616]
MKTFTAIILTLAAAVTAAPTLEARGCTPATYSCAVNPATSGQGWQVCDTQGNWVYSGDCPPDTHCEFYAASGSPYCVPEGFTFPTKI